MNFNGKVTLIGIFLLTLVFGLAGCTSDKKTAADTKPADNKAATDTTKPATDAKKPVDAASADSIGVPECDEYIKKYEACVMSKVPESARAAVLSSFETSRKQWKEMAANPQAKAGLPNACKMALDMAKQSMSAYSCEW